MAVSFPHVFSLAGLILTFAALTGCGSREPRVPVVAVTGKISFQGQVPAGAQVVLHPVATSAESDVVPSATVKEDGTFAISAYDQGDGAPPGDYIATVEWFRLVSTGDGGGGRGPNVLPVQYASPVTSPIRVTVKPEATELPPIEIR
jgi:hypothetical protein